MNSLINLALIGASGVVGKKIISLLENKNYLKLGKNARKFVNKFQWSKIVEEYKKILN